MLGLLAVRQLYKHQPTPPGQRHRHRRLAATGPLRKRGSLGRRSTQHAASTVHAGQHGEQDARRAVQLDSYKRAAARTHTPRRDARDQAPCLCGGDGGRACNKPITPSERIALPYPPLLHPLKTPKKTNQFPIGPPAVRLLSCSQKVVEVVNK